MQLQFQFLLVLFRQPRRIFIPAVMLLRIRKLERESFSLERCQILPIIKPPIPAVLYNFCDMESNLCLQLQQQAWTTPRNRGQGLTGRTGRRYLRFVGFLSLRRLGSPFTFQCIVYHQKRYGIFTASPRIFLLATNPHIFIKRYARGSAT